MGFSFWCVIFADTPAFACVKQVLRMLRALLQLCCSCMLCCSSVAALSCMLCCSSVAAQDAPSSAARSVCRMLRALLQLCSVAVACSVACSVAALSCACCVLCCSSVAVACSVAALSQLCLVCHFLLTRPSRSRSKVGFDYKEGGRISDFTSYFSSYFTT